MGCEAPGGLSTLPLCRMTDLSSFHTSKRLSKMARVSKQQVRVRNKQKTRIRKQADLGSPECLQCKPTAAVTPSMLKGPQHGWRPLQERAFKVNTLLYTVTAALEPSTQCGDNERGYE